MSDPVDVQEGKGGWVIWPPSISKLRVVGLSGENSGLLLVSTRDKWCVFDLTSIFDPVMRGERAIFLRTRQYLGSLH